MGKYKVIIQPTAELDLSKHKKAGNVATIKKIIQILKELQEHPFSGSGKPEALKHNLSGLWWRRINKKRPIDLRSARRNCDGLCRFSNGSL